MTLASTYSVVSFTLAPLSYFFFFFNDTATTEIYTLSLHDALPISRHEQPAQRSFRRSHTQDCTSEPAAPPPDRARARRARAPVRLRTAAPSGRRRERHAAARRGPSATRRLHVVRAAVRRARRAHVPEPRAGPRVPHRVDGHPRRLGVRASGGGEVAPAPARLRRARRPDRAAGRGRGGPAAPSRAPARHSRLDRHGD